MPDDRREVQRSDKEPGSEKAGLAAVGVAALALACCGGLPLAVGLAGGLTAGAALGIGGGALLLVAFAGGLGLMRARRRRACAVKTTLSETSEQIGHPRDGTI